MATPVAAAILWIAPSPSIAGAGSGAPELSLPGGGGSSRRHGVRRPGGGGSPLSGRGQSPACQDPSGRCRTHPDRGAEQALDAAGGDAGAALRIALEVREPGTYAVIVGSQFRAGATGGVLPQGEAGRLATEAFEARRSQGVDAVLADFVERVADERRAGAAGGRGGRDGGGGGGGGFLLLLLGIPLAIFGVSRMRRRRAERAQLAEVKEFARDDLVALGDDIRALDLDVEMPDVDPAAKRDYARTSAEETLAGATSAAGTSELERVPATLHALSPERVSGRGVIGHVVTAERGPPGAASPPACNRHPTLSRTQHPHSFQNEGRPDMTDPDREQTTGGPLGKLAGRAKEAAGSALGKEDLAREGRLQQAQAEAEQEADAEAAEASQREAEAELEDEKAQTEIEREGLRNELEAKAREEAAERDRHEVELEAEASARRQETAAELERRVDESAADVEEKEALAQAEAEAETARRLEQEARRAEQRADLKDPEEN